MNWNVEIKGSHVVTKTINVEADTEDEAVELAHELFTMQHEDGIEENYYDEETISVIEA